MIIEFKSWHLDMMRLTSNLREIATKNVASLERLSEAALVGTIIANAESPVILGVVGAIALDEKTCEVFIVSSEDRNKYRVEFVKSVRQVLDHARREFAKVQALGEDTPFFSRWFSWLGFKREGFTDRPGREGMVMWSMAGGGV